MFWHLMAVNLWNPTHISGWVSIIIVALLLGMIHGITPDEHTWPITFSYAIGSYSTRRGLRSGIIFSLAFTLQRAIASELAYLGLSRLYTFGSLNNLIYVIVGVLMAVAGLMIVRRKTIFHFELPFLKAHHIESGEENGPQWISDPKPWMPAVHGFVAGWGFGAFAIIIYTVLAPATHSAAWGWVPGAVFGFGTMIMQALAGALFGFIAVKRGLKAPAIRRVALKTAANTLTWGGIAFILAGIFGQLFPSASSFAVNTGLHVHNLDSLGLAFILVVVCVVGVGLSTLIVETRRELHKIKKTKPNKLAGNKYAV
jgi:Cytochrome C biogenesis protein transmembrane region